MPATSRSFMKRAIGATLLIAASIVGCTQLDAWQREAIFSPVTEQQSWWRDPPEGTQEFDIALNNGDKIHAWYWQSPKPNAPTLLYLHGARWNLNGSAFRMESWTDREYSMLAIDYRGFGKSTPRLPSEETASEDAAAAFAELVRRQPDPRKRFIYGHSLGGAVAIDLASRKDLPEYAGLIVESSFTSIGGMLGTLKYGWVPGLNFLVTQPFDSLDKLATLTAPILFIHGTADRVVPHEMSDALYAAATKVAPNLRRLVKIDGASHSSAVRSGNTYWSAVASFTRDAMAAYRDRKDDASPDNARQARRAG